MFQIVTSQHSAPELITTCAQVKSDYIHDECCVDASKHLTSPYVKQGSQFVVNVAVMADYRWLINSVTIYMRHLVDAAVLDITSNNKFLNGAYINLITQNTGCGWGNYVPDLYSAGVSQPGRKWPSEITKDMLDNVYVSGIVGGSCSGSTKDIANTAANYSIPVISPSATSTTLSSVANVYRTCPSDKVLGTILAKQAFEQGKTSVSIAYIDSEYGESITNGFVSSYQGTVRNMVAIPKNWTDIKVYTDVLKSNCSLCTETYVLFAFVEDASFITESIANGVTDFVLGDGMYGSDLWTYVEGNFTGIIGTPLVNSSSDFKENDSTLVPYQAESYDATMVMLLAMHSANSSDPSVYASHIRRVSNAPGVEIHPTVSSIDHALDLLSSGKDIDYVGFSDVEFDEHGDDSHFKIQLYNIADRTFVLDKIVV